MRQYLFNAQSQFLLVSDEHAPALFALMAHLSPAEQRWSPNPPLVGHVFSPTGRVPQIQLLTEYEHETKAMFDRFQSMNQAETHFGETNRMAELEAQLANLANCAESLVKKNGELGDLAQSLLDRVNTQATMIGQLKTENELLRQGRLTPEEAHDAAVRSHPDVETGTYAATVPDVSVEGAPGADEALVQDWQAPVMTDVTVDGVTDIVLLDPRGTPRADDMDYTGLHLDGSVPDTIAGTDIGSGQFESPEIVDLAEPSAGDLSRGFVVPGGLVPAAKGPENGEPVL